ncbi:MAG: PKD domain-containing protein [Saprospiraceae bacterium]
MKQILTSFALLPKHPILLLLLLVGFLFQQGNAQHCFPSFTISTNGNTVSFTDQSSAHGTITSYFWSFGDGHTSTEQNPTHTYSSPGTYNVCLTITAHHPNCTATFCHHVVIHHPPPRHCQAAFTSNQPDLNEPTIDFTDQSTSDGNIGTWEWDFGDGTSSNDQNPSHTFPGPGVYLVCLTITDDDEGCTSHVCRHILIHHPPIPHCHAAFIAHQPDPDQPTFHFTDQSTSNGIIVSWSWDFGDGNTSTDQNPTHTYTAVGAYLVCLTIIDNHGCTSHVCHHVIVHHTPPGHCHAAFHANQHDPAHPIIHFTDLSFSDGMIDAWEWDFGDGHTSNEQNPIHTYAAPGIYLVCLTIHDDDGGCSSHVCHHIQVNHPPAGHCQAAFTFEIDAGGLGVQFTNTSTGTTGHATYFWDFGDGGTSTEENPHHIYPHEGHYTVCLFIEDLTIGCASHICHIITIPHHRLRSGNDQTSQVSVSGHSLINKLSIYPNPVSGTLQVDYHVLTAGRVKFELYNLSGIKEFEFSEYLQSAGFYTRAISVSEFVPGVYLLKTTINGTGSLRRISLH